MTEPTNRQKSSRDQPPLSDFTLIVRPPGRPQAIRVFVDANRADAERYATETGATVEALLLNDSRWQARRRGSLGRPD